MNDMPLKELFEVASPEHKDAIRELAAQAAIPDTGNVDDLVKAYKVGTDLFDKMSRNEKLALLSIITMNRDKYAPKLSFEQRCQILALYRIGIVREDLARMYRVDRRTVGFIYRFNSPHYANVRKEEENLGRQQFIDKYLHPDTINRALAYRQLKEGVALRNNKAAKKKAGLHVIRGKNCTYDHRVVITWCEPNDEIQEAGWYYRDLDSDFPDVFLAVDKDAMKTSDACYKSMINNIFDKL